MRIHTHEEIGHRHGFGRAGHQAGPGRHGFGRSGHGGRGHHFGEDSSRRSRVFDSGELRLVLLKLIAAEPRHGYDLIRAIGELTGGAYEPSPGVVYPNLTLLSDMGHVAEDAGGGPRKSYTATSDGAAHLAERKDEVAALFARLAAMAEMRERTDGGPVRRAMGNLRTVLIEKLSREGTKPQTLHDVAAILDETARRIEQL